MRDGCEHARTEDDDDGLRGGRTSITVLRDLTDPRLDVRPQTSSRTRPIRAPPVGEHWQRRVREARSSESRRGIPGYFSLFPDG